jgi:CheY-like chemotaxis protein
MLVEDSPADVFLVKKAIEEAGLAFSLEVANDGESAIQMVDRIDAGDAIVPSVLLLDVNVPRKSGNEVLQRLRQSRRCGNIPVVVISSSDSPEDRRRACELGAREYFRKPSSLAEFMQLGALVRRLHEENSSPMPE